MGMYLDAVRPLSDQDLLHEMTRLVGHEREATVRLVASLAEVDTRALYLREGYASLFVYCTQALHLSEGAAYKRIAAARAAKRFPVILDQLAAGDVTLTTIRLLAPHLTEATHVALLAEARHRSTREVEEIVARLKPQPDVPSRVRKLATVPVAIPPPTAMPPQQSATAPESRMAHEEGVSPQPPVANTGIVDTCPWPRGTVEGSRRCEVSVRAPAQSKPDTPVTPLAPARYKVSFTIGAETYAKLRDVQALLRHVVPDGDVAVLFERALEALHREAAKTKRAGTGQPRASHGRAPKPGSRQISADVKRWVWDRDGGRCAFVSESGHRCAERGFLEYHHIVPYAAGGEASVDNIALRCKAHNLHEAERVFGPWKATDVRETSPCYGAGTPAGCLRGAHSSHPIRVRPQRPGEAGRAASSVRARKGRGKIWRSHAPRVAPDVRGTSAIPSSQGGGEAV